MRQRIKNTVNLTFEGDDDLDIRLFSEMKVYVRQSGNRFMETFIPVIVGAKEAYIEIPYDAAMKLTYERVNMQVAYKDENGHPRATDDIYVDVKKLINPGGYNP